MQLLSRFALLSLIVGLFALPALAATTPTIVTPDTMKWTAGTGEMKGVQMAVLIGNPEKPGPYSYRLKLPANTKFPSHFHGDTENVTVISGTLLVGLGDTMDTAKMKELPAGSYVSVPKGLHHYAATKEETVIQIDGTGPSTMTMVKPMKSM